MKLIPTLPAIFLPPLHTAKEAGYDVPVAQYRAAAAPNASAGRGSGEDRTGCEGIAGGRAQQSFSCRGRSLAGTACVRVSLALVPMTAIFLVL